MRCRVCSIWRLSVFHVLPTYLVFLRIGEIYLGIEQFICAEIDSGKSCRLGFLQLFNKAFGYLLPSVLLCSLLTSQAQVKSMSHFSLIQSAPDWILAAWKNGDDALP